MRPPMISRPSWRGPHSSHRKWVLYSLSFLTTSLAAGLVYGWPALRRQLQEDGSTLDEKQLGAIFTVGAWSTQAGRFFEGMARDRFGTRIVICFCLAMVTLGVLGIGLSDADNIFTLSISLFLTGLGSGIHLCTQPVASLFPRHVGITLSSLTGAFQISCLVFLALTTGSAGRKTSFVGYGIGIAAVTVVAGFVFPKGGSFHHPSKQYIKEAIAASEREGKTANQDDSSKGDAERSQTEEVLSEPSAFSQASYEDALSEMQPTEKTRETLEDSSQCSRREEKEEEEDDVDDDDDNEFEEETSKSVDDKVAHHNDDNGHANVTALQQMKNKEYIFLVLWFSICIIPLQYYVGVIGFVLEDKGDDDGFYTNLFAFTYAGAAVIASPFAGMITDKFGFGISQALSTLLLCSTLLIMASARIPLPAQSVGMITYGISRMYIYAVYFIHVGKRFGYINYGTLAGFGLLASAIISLLQYPLIALAADGHLTVVNTVLVVILVSQAPYFVWLYRGEKRTLPR